MIHPVAKTVEEAPAYRDNWSGGKWCFVDFCQEVELQEGNLTSAVAKFECPCEESLFACSERMFVVPKPRLDFSVGLYHGMLCVPFGKLLVDIAVAKMVLKCKVDVALAFDKGGAKIFVCPNDHKIWVILERMKAVALVHE